MESFVGPLVGVAPPGWRQVSRWGDGWTYTQKNGGLRVIIDAEIKADGNRWIHVSASRKDWAPSHADMAFVKESFIGRDRYAYSVWAPTGVHVNIHEHCLHLWALMDDQDGRVLPEFSAILDIGR